MITIINRKTGAIVGQQADPAKARAILQEAADRGVDLYLRWVEPTRDDVQPATHVRAEEAALAWGGIERAYTVQLVDGTAGWTLARSRSEACALVAAETGVEARDAWLADGDAGVTA